MGCLQVMEPAQLGRPLAEGGSTARRSLEKLNFTKLWKLHDVAVQANDPEACNYIEDMLEEQAADVKTAAEYVSQLRRVDKGLGVYVFDKTFQEEDGGLA